VDYTCAHNRFFFANSKPSRIALDCPLEVDLQKLTLSSTPSNVGVLERLFRDSLTKWFSSCFKFKVSVLCSVYVLHYLSINMIVFYLIVLVKRLLLCYVNEVRCPYEVKSYINIKLQKLYCYTLVTFRFIIICVINGGKTMHIFY